MVAVKIFPLQDKQSWFAEQEIYNLAQVFLQNHSFLISGILELLRSLLKPKDTSPIAEYCLKVKRMLKFYTCAPQSAKMQKSQEISHLLAN